MFKNLQNKQQSVTLTVLQSTEALLAFGTRREVRVANGLVDEKLLPFGGGHSLSRRTRQGAAFALFDQAGKTENSISNQLSNHLDVAPFPAIVTYFLNCH